MKKYFSYILLGLIFILITLTAIFSPKSGYKTVSLSVGTNTVQALVAKSATAKERGLGQRDNLATGTVMLFVYNEPGFYKFWMKNMRFPIDIVWLNADKTVNTVIENISPDSYPQTFAPVAPSQYVIETNAFEAKMIGLEVGTWVRF